MPSKAKIIKRAITDAIMNMMTPPLVSVVGSLSDSSADKLSKAIAKVIRLAGFNVCDLFFSLLYLTLTALVRPFTLSGFAAFLIVYVA